MFAVIADRQHQFVFDRIVQKLHRQGTSSPSQTLGSNQEINVSIRPSKMPEGTAAARTIAYTVLDVGDTLR